MPYAVVSHAHHVDDGVYRLVYGEVLTEVVPGIPNPDDPQGPPVTEDDTVQTVINHQDVVWADHDERWTGMGGEEIAAAQRDDVRAALAQKAEREAPKTVTHLSPGGELL